MRKGVRETETEQRTGPGTLAGHFTANGNPRIRLVGGGLPCAINLSFPPDTGSYMCATASSVRSIASVYWIRSLVPIEEVEMLDE